MARYVTKVRTPWSPERAFAYLADLRNFAAWDPGVRRVVQQVGEGAGSDGVFDVTIKSAPTDLLLTYRTVRFEPPAVVRVVAENRLLVSDDTIRVTPDGDGSLVEYDAELTLRGVLGVADLGLRLVFGRIGDRAAAGLRAALDGVEA